jgi:UDP-glucose 4-epimerase
VDGAGVHETSLVPRPSSRNDPGALVRFIQSRNSAGGYLPRMKILVTGATGKVGSRLARRLVQRGDEVRALVRDPARAADLREARIELAEGDLLEAKSLATAVRGVDAVVHCAAFFRGATPEQAQAVNDLGTRHLATAARAGSVKRFIFTSTGLIYGPNGGRLAQEDDPCAPTAAYPVSKLAAERFLLALEGLDVRVLRLPFVYGDGDPHVDEAIPMMRGFSPRQRMSIGHHADVAQAVARLLDTPSPAHRIYNVVDDEAPDFATLFASVGAPPPDGSNAEAGRAFDALLDGRRIREDLGFRPHFPRLEDAIAAGA